MANIFDNNSGTAGYGYGSYHPHVNGGGGGYGYTSPFGGGQTNPGPGPFGAPTTGFPGPSTNVPPTPTPALAPTTTAPNYGWLNGYDYTKLSDPNNSSYNHAKSAIGRTLAQFNPSQGFSDAVLNALNGLGYGQFSGHGDQLSLSGITQQGVQAGLDPHDFTGDFITNWTGNNPNDHSGARWTYAAWDPQTLAALDPSMFAGMSTGGSTAPAFDWQAFFDAMANWQHPTAAPAAPPPPPQAPPTVRPTPSFSGGYVQPGYGGAAQSISSVLPQLLSDPRYANDPLVQQLRTLIGGYQ